MYELMITSTIALCERIPNNVDLANDRTLQRALEHWQPKFLDWWKEMGPHDFAAGGCLSAHRRRRGCAGLGELRRGQDAGLPLGHFSGRPVPDRTIGFGDHFGQPVWQQVPGELRSQFRRIIVTQGDTEPASVEQQHLLGPHCPSLYDLRNLFQVNVEEGRHLWAMVYLLHAHFGRDGREEAEELLTRHSGDVDKPRILGTFNEPISDWLSFFMFTYFTDRDGKFQLKSLAESGFDPLARTCRFMLTEEAHHMFVGETGVGRVVKRTLEVMKEIGTDDPQAIRASRRDRPADDPALHELLVHVVARPVRLRGLVQCREFLRQRHQGPAGRRRSTRITSAPMRRYELETPQGKESGQPAQRHERSDAQSYIKDCEIGVKRWNMQIQRAGHDFRLSLPSPRFRRSIGAWAGRADRSAGAQRSAARSTSGACPNGFPASPTARSCTA